MKTKHQFEGLDKPAEPPHQFHFEFGPSCDTDDAQNFAAISRAYRLQQRRNDEEGRDE